MDLGTTFAYVEADTPRVNCRTHGVVVAAVPWARHNSRFTRVFEDQVAWLACNCSKTAVAELMRVSWRTVGSIVQRVCDESARVEQLNTQRRLIVQRAFGFHSAEAMIALAMLKHGGLCPTTRPVKTPTRPRGDPDSLDAGDYRLIV